MATSWVAGCVGEEGLDGAPLGIYGMRRRAQTVRE